MKPETERGVHLAEHDLRMAAYARREKMFEQCVYHCHQAIEKLLKATWTERREQGTVPRTHNLAGLANDLFAEIAEEDLLLLQRLARQYLPTRYSEYEAEYSAREAGEYYNRTSEIFSWLRQQLTSTD